MKIFKYAMPSFNEVIELPLHSEFVHAAYQGSALQLWFLVDPENKTEKRRFKIVGTGHEINEIATEYLATVHESIFVWHIYETEFDNNK